MFHANEFIANKERETRHKIHSLAERAAKRGRYQTARKAFIKTASPFVSLMLLRVTLKLWRKYNIQHKVRVDDHAKKGELNYESSAEEEEYMPSNLQTPTQRRHAQVPEPSAGVEAIVNDFMSEITKRKPSPMKSAKALPLPDFSIENTCRKSA